MSLVRTAQQIVFADFAGDFGPAAANDMRQGTPQEIQMQFASVADDAAVNGDKFNLGEAWARRWALWFVFEGAATPTTATPVNGLISPSTDATAANGNAGYVDGSDGAYTGSPATLDEGLAQLEFVGPLIASADATPTIQKVKMGIYVPTSQYGSLVIVNRTGAAFHSDDVEMHAVLDPMND